MRKFLLFIYLTAAIQFANAQQDSVAHQDSATLQASTVSQPNLAEQRRTKNLVKVNLTSIVLRNYSVTYERAIGKKISLGIGARYMPEGKLPFLSDVKTLIDDEDLNRQLNDFKTSNVAITPEVRFYFGKDVFRGFYIAPFARYAVYNADMPYEFDVEVDNGSGGVISRTETIPLSGDIKTFTGGIQFGAQWKLGGGVYLDWFILGPHYGSSTGKIAGTKDLSPEEQDALRDSLNDLEDSDIPLVKIKTSVDAKGAQADFDGPWAGIKAGISIGYRF